MSTYIDTSLISHINNGVDIELDSLISLVIKRSIEICIETDGMFDVTVSPLVDYWGFGPNKNRKKHLSHLDTNLYQVGCSQIFLSNNKLIKSTSVFIDLNGIAQGFSVDYVSNYLRNQGIMDFMVEIGGEIRCVGNNIGNGWKIGVDEPTDKKRHFAYVLKLSDIALATSGSYRNYYYADSIKISHTINPKTFYPVVNQLISATILYSDCMSADAYATACMSLGFQDAKRFLNKNKIMGALIYVEENDTIHYFSNDFSSFLHRSPDSAPQ
jgi:thiamine biosynthesis lipoprotein